ncbi:hypothetical protein C7U66_37555, partial [Bradyrhizobium sp. WBAH30]|nr:hypothetical protein [Bradyrhizobium sp. WBAH30]
MPAAGQGHPPAEAQPESRRRARRQEAFHPVVPGLASPSEPGWRRVRALPTPVVRPAAAECCRAPAWPLARAWRPGPVTLAGVAARQDVRRAEVRRGDQPAVRRACCPEPALRSVRVSPSEPALLPARARRGVPWAQLSEQAVLPSAQA